MKLLTPGPSPKERGANSLLSSPSEKGANSHTPKPKGGLNSRNKFIKAIATGCILMSCGNSDKPAPAAESQPASTPAPIARLDIKRDSVITLTIPSDTSQSYSIYFPSKTKDPEGTPIIICFDPHGDGRLPIDKYKKWADKFGIAIAGSNSARNEISMAEGQKIAANMIDDISYRLGFDKRNEAICGFSGGSRVAISAMSDPELSNLIFAGAVNQINVPQTIYALGFAGTQDMNYTDLIQFDQDLMASKKASLLIEFNGKHEWPDAQTFEKAFYWLTFRTWGRTRIAQQTGNSDSVLIAEFARGVNNAITSSLMKKDWLDVYKQNSIGYYFLLPVREHINITLYGDAMKALVKNDSFAKALDQKNAMLKKEINEKQTLITALQNQSIDWWKKVTSQYQSSSDPSDKRLLGFISLAGFSYSNQMLQQQNLDGAERMLAIYELADPANTDQLYFHAVLYAERKNTPLAVRYLQRAVSNGFKDGQKIEAEPAFTALRNDPNFSQIVAALKKASK